MHADAGHETLTTYYFHIYGVTVHHHDLGDQYRMEDSLYVMMGLDGLHLVVMVPVPDRTSSRSDLIRSS